MTQLNFGRDVQGFNAYAPATAGNKYSATLTTGMASSITVPSNYQNWIVVFSYQSGVNCWVDFSGAMAVVPVGGTFASTTAELNPAARSVVGGSSISVITSAATSDVGMMLYAIS